MAIRVRKVYARVKKKVPAISLATVYKNIHLFVESGVFREVSMHHGSVRVEMNREPHHHMVCSSAEESPILGKKSLGWWPSGIGCRTDFWWNCMQWTSLAFARNANWLRMIRYQRVFEVMYGRRDEEQSDDNRRWPAGWR